MIVIIDGKCQTVFKVYDMYCEVRCKLCKVKTLGKTWRLIGGVEVYFQMFKTSALDGNEW